jgi:hypothetical protein
LPNNFRAKERKKNLLIYCSQFSRFLPPLPFDKTFVYDGRKKNIPMQKVSRAPC